MPETTKSPEDYLPNPEELAAAYIFAEATDEEFEAAIEKARSGGGMSRANVLRLLQPRVVPDDEARPLVEERIEAGVSAIRTGLADVGGIARLRILESLLRGVPGVDGGDPTIQEVLLGIACEAMEAMPSVRAEGDPIERLSSSIAWVLPHLWRGDHEATALALAVLSIDASNVPDGVRPDFLLQVLDGRPVEQVHPTTRLVVDALLAGFAVEQVSA